MKFLHRQSAGPIALHYVVGPASGPPLLLLHGVLRSWRDWLPLLPRLARTWQVFALDHCGHGRSGRCPGTYFVTDYAQLVGEYVGHTFTEPVTIMGHSLGAMVGLSVAVECPRQVASIVLEDPPFHTMGRDIGSTPYRAQFAGMWEVARRGGSTTTMANRLAAIRISETHCLGDIRDRESLEFSASCLADVDLKVFEPLVDGDWLRGFEAAALWSQVACPALLLQGDPNAGGTFTDNDVSLARRDLREVRHVRFPATGHQVHREHPAEVLAELRRWRRHVTRDR